MTLFGRTLVFALCVQIAGSVSAEETFWVAVASFISEESAQTNRVETAERTSEPVALRGMDTSVGYRYRVLLGPYADRNRAEQVAAQADLDGFSGAWVFHDSDGGSAGSTLPETYDFDDEYPSYEAYPEADDLNAAEQTQAREKSPEPKLVEKAPAGYELHKLRRGD